MPIKYRLVQKLNPLNVEAPKKWYAQAESKDMLTMKALSKRIARQSTASRADVNLVITALMEEMEEMLMNGNSVKLEGIGTFYMTLNGIGADSQEEYSSNLVRKKYIRFRADKELLDNINRATLVRVSEKKAEEGGANPDPEPGPGES
ncbi:MAG: HU family DNA-binding protein [Bacteroidales bacterium]